MKIFFLYLIVAVAMLVSSCERQPKPETNFFRDFYLGEIVEKMNVSGLKRKYSVGDKGTANRKITERQSSYYLEYDIEEQAGEKFDEESFWDNLDIKIRNKIKESGARGGGGGSSNKSFSYTYSKDNNRGSLDVVGTRLEGNKFMLWYFIRESAGEENLD